MRRTCKATSPLNAHHVCGLPEKDHGKHRWVDALPLCSRCGLPVTEQDRCPRCRSLVCGECPHECPALGGSR